MFESIDKHTLFLEYPSPSFYIGEMLLSFLDHD